MSSMPLAYRTLSAQQRRPGVTHLTTARLDIASGRMIFEHLGDVMGGVKTAPEAADLFLMAATLYAEAVRLETPLPRI